MELVLVRKEFREEATFGTMEVDGEVLFTLEPGVDEDEFPAIPEGIYSLEKHVGTKHKNTFALINPLLGVVHWPTPGMRSAILLHAANFAHELNGCIALGTRLGRLRSPKTKLMEKVLLDSGAATKAVLEFIRTKRIEKIRIERG